MWIHFHTHTPTQVYTFSPFDIILLQTPSLNIPTAHLPHYIYTLLPLAIIETSGLKFTVSMRLARVHTITTQAATRLR